MSNNGNSKGPISVPQSGENDTTIETDNQETEESKEQKEMFQRKIRSDLNSDGRGFDVTECRKHKDQTGSLKNGLPRDSMELTFSAQSECNSTKKASDHNFQMTSNQIDPAIRRPLQQINNRIDSITNIQETSTNYNIIHDNGIAYPPQRQGNYFCNTQAFKLGKDNIKPATGEVPKLPSLESKFFMKENHSTANHWSLSSGTLNSLHDNDLECDSLKYEPEQTNIGGPATGFESASALSTSLTFLTGQNKPRRVGPRQIDEEKETKSRYQTPSLSGELLKSLHDGRCELTTDGPTTNSTMTEYISQHLIPALQQQEEESQRILSQSSNLQKENHSLREQIASLEKHMQFQLNNQARNSPLSSRTQVVNVEYLKQAPEHYSIQVSEETETEQDETDPKQNDLLQEIQHLKELNKQLSDANHRWEVEWGSLQRCQATEIDRLNQIIRNNQEQDSKRQEDIDKLLLTAKHRQNEAEDAKEDALGQLAQITGQLEELKVQYEELKTHLVQRTQEKSDLETELVNLKAEQMRLSQNTSKKETKTADKKLIKQLQTDIAVLQQQLKVFEEDFDVERQDRAKAQSEKDNLRKQLDVLRTENAKLTEKLRESQQRQQTGNNVNRRQHPTAQPETDPYAQPYTPVMMLPQYNNQQIPRTGTASVTQQQAYGTWNCEFCTYVNHPQRVICEICGTRRGRGQPGNISQMNQRRGQQQRYDPNDLCIDSGDWRN